MSDYLTDAYYRYDFALFMAKVAVAMSSSFIRSRFLPSRGNEAKAISTEIANEV